MASPRPVPLLVDFLPLVVWRYFSNRSASSSAAIPSPLSLPQNLTSPFEPPGFDLGDVEKVAHDLQNGAAGFLHLAEPFLLLLADRPEDTVLHYLGGIEDGGDRRAQIVRDHRREVGLKLVGLFQLSGLMFNLVQRLFVKPPGDDVA